MELPAQDVLDLRSNPRDQGIELAAGTLLYTVIPRDDVGSSGPYFTEPGRALYWGFHVMIAMRRSMPTTLYNLPNENVGWDKGQVATEYFFPGSDIVLLEIKTDRKIIFSNQMMDANPYGYVHYRYGSHDPISLPVQVNVDDKNISLVIKNTCKEHSWSQPVIQRVFYYGLMAMIPVFVFKGDRQSTVPSWIAIDAQGRVDVNQSLNRLFQQLGAVKDNVDAYHEYIVETGIRICRPAEIIASRSYFPVKWETAWLVLIGLLSQAGTSATIKDYFIHNVLQLITPTRVRVDAGQALMSFDGLVLARIVSWCHSICDALAFCSINRKMRTRVAPLPVVQKILRLKFMPRMNNFFAVLPLRDTPEREDLLGIPTKSCGHRWWKMGSVLFAEDFEEIDDTLHLGAQPVYKTGALTISRDPNKPLTRAQVHLLARFGSEETSFERLELHSHEIQPLVRGCNSFISMFSMLYSMSNYDATPRGTEMLIHVHDTHGNIDLVTRVMASMPPETTRSTTNPLELLSARPTASYREAVRRAAPCGSWLHDNGTPYFFLDQTFSTRLDKAKAFELQRYEISMFMTNPTKRKELTSEHIRVAKMFLTNDLLFYKDSAVLLEGAQTPLVAFIRYSMKGGYSQSNKRGVHQHSSDVTTEDHIMIFLGGLSQETLMKLQNPALHADYETNMHQTYEYTIFDVDRTTSRVGSNIDGTSVTDLFRTNVVGIEIGLRKNSAVDSRYYAAYMTLCCIIRMILRDGCNRVEWRTNF